MRTTAYRLFVKCQVQVKLQSSTHGCTYRHTHRHTHAHTDTDTHTHTHTHTHTQGVNIIEPWNFFAPQILISAFLSCQLSSAQNLLVFVTRVSSHEINTGTPIFQKNMLTSDLTNHDLSASVRTPGSCASSTSFQTPIKINDKRLRFLSQLYPGRI